MLENLGRGLTSLGGGGGVFFLIAGSLIGMFVGVVPGLGGAVVLSIILVFVYHLSLTATLCLFLASHAGSYFSASVSSILLDTPAHPEAFAVTFDGFPMAQRGEAGRALGISAASTCIGGIIGCVVLVGFIQIINVLPSIFHPPEYVGLVLVALFLVGTLGTDAASKAVISGGIGLMLACIGASPVNGQFRFTFGAVGLFSGISLVALTLGLFAIPQMILVFGTSTTIAKEDMMGNAVADATEIELGTAFGKQVWRGTLETFKYRIALVRAAIIGVVTGVVPGIGGFAANFLAYGIAQQTSKRRALFGTGIAEGIIAPEGSSLAKEAGSMVPILGLGIPGGVGGALFLAALTIKGIKTGYGFTTEYPVLPYEMVWIIALGGLIGTFAGALSAPLLARVTRVPGPALVPIIFVLSVVGPFVASVSFFTVIEVVIFAIVGLVLRRLRYSLASFAIGLVLGPTLEDNIYLTHNVFPSFTWLERPLADVLFAIAIGVLVLKTVQLRREAKRSRAEEAAADPILGAEGRMAALRQHRYPLLSLIATIGILGFSVPFTIYGLQQYTFTTALMPVVASVITSVVAIARLPREVISLVEYRRRASLEKADISPLSVGAAPLVDVGSSPVGELAIDGTAHASTIDLVEALGEAPSLESAAAPIGERTWGRHGQYTRELISFCWLGALVGGSYIFGFTVAVPVFCFLYGVTATGRFLVTPRRRVVFAAITAAAMWGVTYGMFDVLHLTFTPKI